jgi:hypothetical protein
MKGVQTVEIKASIEVAADWVGKLKRQALKRKDMSTFQTWTRVNNFEEVKQTMTSKQTEKHLIILKSLNTTTKTQNICKCSPG